MKRRPRELLVVPTKPRLKALGEFIREHEAEQGVITEQEVRDARRHFSTRTTAVRPTPPARRRVVPPKRGAS